MSLQIDSADPQYICEWNIYRRTTKAAEIWNSPLSLTLTALSQELCFPSSWCESFPCWKSRFRMRGANGASARSSGQRFWVQLSPAPTHIPATTQQTLAVKTTLEAVGNRGRWLWGVIPAPQPSTHTPGTAAVCELERAVNTEASARARRTWA